ncbi:unnamed protein product, partial [Pylaiella littoralis]
MADTLATSSSDTAPAGMAEAAPAPATGSTNIAEILYPYSDLSRTQQAAYSEAMWSGFPDSIKAGLCNPAHAARLHQAAESDAQQAQVGAKAILVAAATDKHQAAQAQLRSTEQAHAALAAQIADGERHMRQLMETASANAAQLDSDRTRTEAAAAEAHAAATGQSLPPILAPASSAHGRRSLFNRSRSPSRRTPSAGPASGAPVSNTPAPARPAPVFSISTTVGGPLVPRDSPLHLR